MPCGAPDGAMKRFLLFCSLTVPPSAFQASRSADDAIAAGKPDPSTLALARLKMRACPQSRVASALQCIQAAVGTGQKF